MALILYLLIALLYQTKLHESRTVGCSTVTFSAKKRGKEALGNLSISNGEGATIKEVPLQNRDLLERVFEGGKEKGKSKALPEWTPF